jgi:hypothetical protein
MLRYAIEQRDWREVMGQLVRLALAPLGALTGRTMRLYDLCILWWETHSQLLQVEGIEFVYGNRHFRSSLSFAQPSNFPSDVA